MAGVSAMAVVTTSDDGDSGDDGNGGAVGGDVDSGGGGGIASSGIAKADEKIDARVAHTNTSHAKMLNRRFVLQASTHERGMLSGRRSSRSTARSYEGGVI